MALEVDTDGHIRALTQTLNEMRGIKEHCDFTIRVGSLEIFAHKNVLSAGSDYFKAMLSHDTKENQTGVAEIKEAEPTCVKKCVDFIYTGIPPKLDDDIEPLMYVAHLMQLTELCEGICKYLDENLSPETFFTAQKLANLHSLESLAEKCDHFALSNFEQISQTDAFFHFDKKYVKKLLGLKTVVVKEESKLDAILRWVKFDSEKRNNWLDELLKYVSLPMIPTAYLRYLIVNESLINENNKFLKMLSLVVMDKMSVEEKSYKDLTSKKDYIVIFDKASGYLQKFSPTDNSLVQMQKMNDDMMKSYFTAVCVDEYIYVLMRNKSVYRLLYSDKEATWEQMESFAFDHGDCPPAVSLKNNIYVIGGQRTCSTKSVEKYDTRFNKWTKLPDKPHESQNSEPVVLNSHIYCCGGFVAGKYHSIVERFDPENLAWMTVAPMNENKGFVSAVEFEGKLFVLGGWTDGKHFATVESYEHQHNIWKIVNHMRVPRSWFRSFEINGELYAVGGYNSSPETIEKYNSEKVWRNIDIADGTKLKILESVKVKF